MMIARLVSGTAISGVVSLFIVAITACRPAIDDPRTVPVAEDNKAKVLSEDELIYEQSVARMREKFGKHNGGDLVVDSMQDQGYWAVKFFPPGRDNTAYFSTVYVGPNRGIEGRNSIPERLRIEWRDSSEKKFVENVGDVNIGNIIGNVVVEVGSRIPQELLDDLKRDPRGSIRLKFRMGHQGPMFGWDIERRPNPGYGPNYRGSEGSNIWVPAVHSFAGGDFREAEIFNGKPVRKGWYIDKRTGQKIETDF